MLTVQRGRMDRSGHIAHANFLAIYVELEAVLGARNHGGLARIARDRARFADLQIGEFESGVGAVEAECLRFVAVNSEFDLHPVPFAGKRCRAQHQCEERYDDAFVLHRGPHNRFCYSFDAAASKMVANNLE